MCRIFKDKLGNRYSSTAAKVDEQKFYAKAIVSKTEPILKGAENRLRAVLPHVVENSTMKTFLIEKNRQAYLTIQFKHQISGQELKD